jgi:hypothetical protein
MKALATALFLIVAALPAVAATVWDESVDGDLSSNAAAPTPIAFALGSNVLLGTVSGLPLDRDYITFTIPADQVLSHLNLLELDPDNIAFTAFNSGSTSFIPSGSTNASFLSGIHITADDVGFDLMPFFDTRNVTTNSLPAPSLGPGTYCWLIQQTSAIVQSWQVEFVFEGVVPTEAATWGKIKALYR